MISSLYQEICAKIKLQKIFVSTKKVHLVMQKLCV